MFRARCDDLVRYRARRDRPSLERCLRLAFVGVTNPRLRVRRNHHGKEFPMAGQQQMGQVAQQHREAAKHHQMAADHCERAAQAFDGGNAQEGQRLAQESERHTQQAQQCMQKAKQLS